jgi:protein SCO1
MMLARFGLNIAILGALLCWGQPGFAYDPHRPEGSVNQTPKELEGIGITERLAHPLDLSTPFVADTGEQVTLGKYFSSGRPVLLSIVYYNCASLCNLHLNGVTAALKEMPWTAGQEFELVAISMDARETPAIAAAKKANYIKAYGRPDAASGWHFLTGSAASIERVTKDLGFKFRWEEQTNQFAHASAAVIITPGGVVSRYIHGISPQAQDFRFALFDASGGKVGNIIDKLVMFCFKYDPLKSKYTLYAWNIMRIGMVATALIVAVLLVPLWWRERQSQPIG